MVCFVGDFAFWAPTARRRQVGHGCFFFCFLFLLLGVDDKSAKYKVLRPPSCVLMGIRLQAAGDEQQGIDDTARSRRYHRIV